MSYDKRPALITGSERRNLLGLGARAVVTDRSHCNSARTASVAEFGPQAGFALLAVASEAAWQHTIASVGARHGTLYALVNLAGVFTPGVPFEDMTLA